MDRPAPRPASPRRGRPFRWVDRDLIRKVGGAIVIGVVTGIALHVLDSAPESVAFLGQLIRLVLGFVLVLSGIAGLARLVMIREGDLALGCVGLLAGALIAYPLGPTWIPAETVGGTYTIVIEGAGMTPASGTLACTWLPGRWRVGDFAATAPVAIPRDEKVLLRASFTLPQVRLDRTTTDGTLRAAYVNGADSVLEPRLLDDGQPARTADGRSGQDQVPLSIDASSPPEGVTGWSAPIAGDTGAGITVDLTWTCDGP